ncbi:unnamed protein product [Ceratitis capitata]|uniref:(Mediterranean fruit fly) hypothetical protein n=1 Tax=Ceratitis capitata TaxID=7213 RepID=A0A811U8N4_CERCA|nr:unnamed protein product [Ceratitis capitata]
MCKFKFDLKIIKNDSSARSSGSPRLPHSFQVYLIGFSDPMILQLAKVVMKVTWMIFYNVEKRENSIRKLDFESCNNKEADSFRFDFHGSWESLSNFLHMVAGDMIVTYR